MLSVYSMTKPNRSGNLANLSTSFPFSKNDANSFSNALSQGTRLNTDLAAATVGRDHGKGGVSDSGRPAWRSSGWSSVMTIFRSATANVLTVTYWATLLLIALIIVRWFNSTGPPNAL